MSVECMVKIMSTEIRDIIYVSAEIKQIDFSAETSGFFLYQFYFHNYYNETKKQSDCF